MIKKIILIVSIIVNVLLGLALLLNTVGAIQELKFQYVEEETITPDSMRKYLEWENYGVVAAQSHPIRGGAEIKEEYMDYYRLGEYADLLFLKEVFDKAGNESTLADCNNRLAEIRESMPEYAVIFDKMDISEENAIKR